MMTPVQGWEHWRAGAAAEGGPVHADRVREQVRDDGEEDEDHGGRAGAIHRQGRGHRVQAERRFDLGFMAFTLQYLTSAR